jgi:hypothetical protein
LSLQFGAKFVNQELFLHAPEAAGAAVDAAVTRIKDNDWRLRSRGRIWRACSRNSRRSEERSEC